MKNFRIHGEAPFNIALVHGGPGALGEMEPVALELAPKFGVLEPLQTATTLTGQIEELRLVLEIYAGDTIYLIGFSWGAWLSYLVTAHYPGLVKKLILVGSGPYKPEYVSQITANRISRLTEHERIEYHNIIQLLGDPQASDKSENLARLGQLAAKADRYDPVEVEYTRPKNKLSERRGNEFHVLMKAAQNMREDGRLLAYADQIQCPVTAIHGDYDPHPVEGVSEPLAARLDKFHLVLLKNCGHKPWIERQAKDQFYATLRDELR